MPDHVRVITGQVWDIESNEIASVSIEVSPMVTPKLWNKVLGIPVEDFSYHINTGSDGRFSTSVTGFSYIVTIRKEGYQALSISGEPWGQNTNLVVHLTRK